MNMPEHLLSPEDNGALAEFLGLVHTTRFCIVEMLLKDSRQQSATIASEESVNACMS